MGGWGEKRGPRPTATGPTTGELEAIELMLTAAGAPDLDERGGPLRLRDRVEWLTSTVVVDSCDRCEVSHRVVRGSTESLRALEQFLAAHRHVRPAPGDVLIEHVRRLDVQPGDVVELQLATQASRETLATVRADLERLLPEGVHTVVLGRPSSLTVKLSDERRRPGAGRRPA